eukprot:4858198-Heterocapsa_arctica.AAC.1
MHPGHRQLPVGHRNGIQSRPRAVWKHEGGLPPPPGPRLGLHHRSVHLPPPSPPPAPVPVHPPN